MKADQPIPDAPGPSVGDTDGANWPVLVFLSGPKRGTVQRIVGKTVRVIVGEGAEVRLTEPGAVDSKDYFATLHRSGSSYELQVGAGQHVWVNGNKVDESLLLQPGDLIELGVGGPLARFRVYPQGARLHPSPREVLADSRDLARRDGRSPLTRSLLMIASSFQGITSYTSVFFRVWVMVFLTVLGVGVVLLIRQAFWFERQIATGSVQIEELSELVDRTANRAVDLRELAELKKELETAMSTTSERVAALEARGVAAERIIASATPSVLFVLGQFGFVEPESQRPLRVLTVAPGQHMYGFDSAGVPVEIHFTGTAFVVNEQGFLVTSRHVAIPWESDPAHKAIQARGLEPVLQRLIAYAPGRPKPFELEVVASSETADVALLRLEPANAAPPPLALGEETVILGEEVLVLGYPTGLKAMLARTDPSFVKSLTEDPKLGLWEGVERLAQVGHIAPLATLGIVGQVTSSAVVYDAETTVGGSGGPVFDLEGNVVAVNGAIIPEFGGSNLGVPIRHALKLVAADRALATE